MEPLTEVASWATPTSLFLLLNVVIGFIAVSSVFNSKKNDNQEQPQPQPQPQRLVRAPSLFSRVTSFNFRAHSAAPEPQNRPLITPLPSFLSRLTSFNSLHLPRSAESETTVPLQESENFFESETAPVPSFFSRVTSFNRSVESETIPADESERAPCPSPSLLTRMASIKLSLHRSTESEVITVPEEANEQHVTRSATEPKLRKKKKPPTGKMTETATLGNGEVDAQADDFINRFKQQLRMQRLDSLIRYRNSSGSS